MNKLYISDNKVGCPTTVKLRGFEKVSKYKDSILPVPCRKTEWSAGYDMAAAHDAVIEPFGKIVNELLKEIMETSISKEIGEMIQNLNDAGKPEAAASIYKGAITLELDQIKKIMKEHNLKPTLISTGCKAYMQPYEKLNLLIRSSVPLNSFIIMANSDGLIDADYYNNPDNEGEIFFQVLNLSPVPIKIKKGDILGQGVFSTYLITDDDHLTPKASRVGGLGSTTK